MSKSTLLKGAMIGAGIAILIAIGFILLSQSSAKEKIDFGDTVLLNYTMHYAKNGTQIKGPDIAKIKVGDGAISAAFDKSILGLKMRDKKTFTLKAEDAFGKYDLGLIRQYPKFKTFNRAMVVPLEEIRGTTTSQYNITEGAKIKTLAWPWPIMLQKIAGGEVTIYHEPALDSLYLDPFILVWPLKVTGLSNETVTIEQMPRIGSVIDDEILGRGRVVYIQEDKITVDYNMPYAGNDITFDVEIESVQKPA